jgi:glycosyltransferase involved in cell wall biosynthesis
VDTEANEPDAFAVALNRLLDAPELRQSLGAAGRQKMESEYDRRSTQEAYLSLFESAAAS